MWLRSVYTPNSDNLCSHFHSTCESSRLSQLVEGPTENLWGNPSLTSPTLKDPYNRCFSSGMEGSPPRSHSPGQVVHTRGHAPQEHSGAEGSSICLSTLISHHTGPLHQGNADNRTAVYYINWQGGERSQSLCTELLNLWNWCIFHQIKISVLCLQGLPNTAADSWVDPSFRITNESSTIVFHSICQTWGLPEADLCATPNKTKCPFLL